MPGLLTGIPTVLFHGWGGSGFCVWDTGSNLLLAWALQLAVLGDFHSRTTRSRVAAASALLNGIAIAGMIREEALGVKVYVRAAARGPRRRFVLSARRGTLAAAAPDHEEDGMTGLRLESAAPAWDLRLLYDGDCPLCSREVALLRRRDKRSRIQFEDIAAPDFDASRYGLDQHAVMARIHGVLPDGRVIEGMEVFRRAYAAVGLGWLLAPSRWPGVGRLFDAAYRGFARNRLRWTGREVACEAGHCEVAAPPARRGS